VYNDNFGEASMRHMQDADLLFCRSRWDTAGYHYGFSAECALKAALKKTGATPPPIVIDNKKKNPFRQHFPTLKRVQVSYIGRTMTNVSLALALAKDDFLDQWHTNMRYSPNIIEKSLCEKWRTDVKDFVAHCSEV
jgi:hypothetical protein